MRLIWCIILFVGSYSYVSAQTAACTRRLADAEEAFDQGRLLDVINNQQFMDCFDDFSIEEQVRAHKLLTKAHIFTDNEEEAEASLLNLLKADKEHNLAREDPSELHFLYSQFKTEPIFRVGMRIAANKSFPVILQSHNTLQVGQKNYNEKGNNTKLGIGFSFEALLERHIKKGVEVGLGGQLRIANYEVEGELLDEVGELFYVAKNQSTMLRVPLLVRYNFNYNKKDSEGVRLSKMPYVFVGASYDYLIEARYVSTDRTGGNAFTLEDDNDIKPQLAETNATVFIGAGVKLRFGRAQVHFLTAELRYNNALFNYVNPDNRYLDKDINFTIGHVEDDLALNTISLSLGATISFYNPKKRKIYR